MKITKAQGRACLRELAAGNGWGAWPASVCNVVAGIGWTAFHKTADDDPYFAREKCQSHEQTALAMCAAIAGVRPESEGD